MKSSALVIALALSGCAWDAAMLPLQQPIIASKPDPSAALIIQCDRLGFRSVEAHRLCVLRGIDRLSTTPGPTTSYAPIQILPYAYPPLAPSNSIHVVPLR